MIAGVLRCGKSSLLDLIRIAIESEGVADCGSVSVSLESSGTGIWRGKVPHPITLPLHLLP